MEYSHREIIGVPGSQVFDTKSNWLLVGQCVREALASACTGPDAVAAVSATSMREDMVLYDQHDEEVWACPNADSRADWSERIVHICGLEREIFPSVSRPALLSAASRHRSRRDGPNGREPQGSSEAPTHNLPC